MADFRSREDWARTANVMALIANCNRDPKKRPSPYSPAEFGRYARTKAVGGIPVTKETIGLMRAEFENGSDWKNQKNQNRKG